MKITDGSSRGAYTWTDIGFINTARGKYWCKADLVKAYKNDEILLVIPENETHNKFTHLLVVDKETNEIITTLNRHDSHPEDWPG